MLKINKKVEYALMALKFMAKRQEQEGKDKLTSAREVCDQFHTPFDTTAKVMQKMNNCNILKSVKGIRGGYLLAVPLEQITYMEIVDIVEENRKESICQTTKGLCECYDYCNIKSPIKNLNDKLNQYLQQLTLEELLMKETPEAISSKTESCPGEELAKKLNPNKVLNEA